MKKYDRFLSRLFACCEIQDNYPHSPVLINTEKISDVLETAFLEEKNERKEIIHL